MGSGCDGFAELRKVQVHPFAVAGRRIRAMPLPCARLVGGTGALIARRAEAGATHCPAA